MGGRGAYAARRKAGPPAAQTASTASAARVATPEASAHADVESRIRATFDQLTGGRDDFVSLAEIRDALPDVPRSEQDAALLHMLDHASDVRIVPVANIKGLKNRDRAAALRIGGEDNHAFKIGRTYHNQ